MTRSVTIVNSSNWDNEPLRIEQPGRKDIVLETGESVTFSLMIQLPEVCQMKIVPIKGDKEPEPRRVVLAEDDDREMQLTPKVKVVWE